MKRIQQVDFFRGLFLVIITANHFLSWQNIIYRFTHEFIGWITAAEGFVFLSGLTAGIVYTRKLIEKGEAFISGAVKKRAWNIYKYHLILFLLIILIFFSHSVMKEYWLNNHVEYKLLFQKPLFAAILSSIMLYQPIYMDILPMYALFLLLLPLALKYFQSGRHVLILAFSLLIYLTGTFKINEFLLNQVEFLSKVNTGYFNLLSWQLLFIGGLFLGFLTYQNKTSHLLENRKLFLGALGVCVLLFFCKNSDYLLGSLSSETNYWVSKENLGPLRLLNFSALLIVMSCLASRYKQWFSFKPVCHLGKYSLEVFSFHILLIIIFKPIKELIKDHYAIKIIDGLYFNIVSTTMLLFILIPALFVAPEIKKYLNQSKLKLKPAA